MQESFLESETFILAYFIAKIKVFFCHEKGWIIKYLRRNVMLSASLEDYLEEIYRLSVEKGIIRASDIAACLGVTLPSVSKALQRLTENGQIDYKPYGNIQLTVKGRDNGKYLVERNSLLQDFFRLMEIDANVEKEAEAVEHYLSRSTIKAINSLNEYFKIEEHYQSFLNFKSSFPDVDHNN